MQVVGILIITLAMPFVAGCEEGEWKAPFYRQPDRTSDQIRNFCNPMFITGVPGTDGDPRRVSDTVLALARWRAESPEYWKFPEETIEHGFGDCEDLSCLAIALLFRDHYPDDVMMAFGMWKGDPHVWVVLPSGEVINNGEWGASRFEFDLPEPAVLVTIQSTVARR